MSNTTAIRQSEDNFKLAQKIVASLSESFNFSFDEGWSNICSTNIDALKRKFKKDSKKNNPYSGIKNPRTSFSFYTKENRANIAKKNPKATFGELSKLVSAEWNSLTEKDKKIYKNKEIKDKARYKKEREALAKQLESQAASAAPAATEEVIVSPAPKASSKTTKSKSKSSGKSTGGKSATKSASKSSSPSSYNIFQKKMRPQLKEQFPNAATKEITSKLGEAWRALSDEEKATYA